MFDHILNWTLRAGSHEFPGPDGGTCINEAAVVAAGFKYRKIESAGDCPPCFSRVFATYALRLNDAMPEVVRNRLLMPFVTRLAGTADTPEIERQRAEFMAIQTVRRILPPVLRARGLVADAIECEAATTLQEAKKAAYAADAASDAAADAAYAAYAAAADAADAAYDAAASDAAAAASDAAAAAYAAAAAAYAADAAAYAAAWQIAVDILDEAMRIGRQPEPIDLGLIAQRMDAIKATTARQHETQGAQ